MAVTLSFALALLLTTVLLPLCRRLAPAAGLMDASEADRKVHTSSIPRSGGIAIVVGVAIAAAAWMPVDGHYLPLLASVSVIVVFGLLDDLKELPHYSKLAGQVLAAAVFVWAYGALPQVPFFQLDAAPGWLSLLFTLGFLIGVTNGVNLSDGLDGLAAGNSLLSLCLLAVFAAQIDEIGLLVLALTVCGGLLGFLRFNTHPATIFMGDTGSQFLGFTAAALAVLILQQEAIPLSPMVPVLIFGLPILDTLAVMGVRAATGRPLFKADSNHLHHQLLRLGFRHYEVVTILYGLQAVIVGLAYVLRYESDLLVLGVYVVYCVAVLGAVFGARAANWKVRPARGAAGSIDRRNGWMRHLSWYQTNVARVLAALAGAFLVGAAAYLQAPSRHLADVALVSAGIMATAWMYFREHPKLVCRLISFTASALVLYVIIDHPGAGALFNRAADIYLIGLAGALFLAIRLTRKNQFHLDNQDYLVLLIIALAPLMPLGVGDGASLARDALRLAVLLYVCELIANKGRGARSVMNLAGIGSLVLLGFS